MDLPENFKLKMQELLGDEYSLFESSLENPSQKGITVNFNKITKKEFEEICDFNITPIPLVDNGYIVSDLKFSSHILNHLGIIYSQEPSAMYPVELLDIKEGDIVLDLCASPGGKSIQILEKLNGSGFLLSNEIVYSRAKILYENLNRMGFNNFAITCNSPQDFIGSDLKFDKIIVDAPCGGEGMFRKDNFDLNAYKQSNIETNAKRQMEILNCAKSLLKDGGHLVYSTCTYDRRENEQVIEKFLNENNNFKIIGNSQFEKISSAGVSDINTIAQNCYRRYPHKFAGEGQFMVKLQKDGDEEIECSNTLPKQFSVLYRNKKNDIIKNFKDIADVENLNIAKRNDAYFALPNIFPNLSNLNILTIGCVIGSMEKSFKINHTFYRNHYDKFYNKLTLNKNQTLKYLKGEEIDIENKNGIYVVMYEKFALGGGKITNGKLKNYYPKELRIN